MVEVEIHSINVDTTSGNPVMVLRPIDQNRYLPIWIGHNEAMAILLALQDAEPPRPLTHDLMKNILDSLEFLLVRVEITRLEEGTFYAALILRGEEREIAVDARPSDSIALAVRAKCPLYIAEAVLEEASVELEESVDEELEVERFREFLENVKPEDFTKQ